MRIYELLANLLIILLSSLGLMRGIEMVLRDDDVLENASSVYSKLSQYIDIQSLGWFLVISSIVLLSSVFCKGKASYLLWVIGGTACGIVHLTYGLIATESAKFINTYYQNVTLSVYQFILASIGVISLWKIKMNKG
ncbi:hypothetical protein KEI82_002452 [Staphylococcus pseudintermedius]|nr:hypothetical protein [Staphylococcus pseudintermedius]EGQ3151786.1 hypothetical protein [Staphylococcus pseudintermedius]EGQ3871478.1 hypothetical protein [Staphylococcus pseudintermedius]EHL7209595.1 hypothetical protein [Staphylococcus pseudintermedius]EHT6215639.1 hypothetical protein [Staphylococcus pseudintermedius]